MPHQFTFQQRFRDGRTVDRHKGLFGPGAFIMDRLGHQFFAGAALTLHQHSTGITFGDFFHHGNHIFHVFAVTDEAFRAILAGVFGADLGDFLLQFAGLQRLADDDGQFVQIEGFVDVVVCSHLHGFDRGFQNPQSGHHDHKDILVNLFDLFQHLKTIDTGELDIQQQQIRQFVPHQS